MAGNTTTQDFVPIKEVRNGVAITKDGAMAIVLIASSVNFALKSQDEQIALLLQYQNFLNSLDFHIQIFVQSRKLDIRPYIQILEERMGEQANDLIKIQTKEYIDFIKNFTESVDIMSKSFFIVIPYSPPVFQSKGFLAKVLPGMGKPSKKDVTDVFEENQSQLEQRVSVVEQGLNRIGIRVAQLGTEELVELYFKIFNPGETDIPSLEGTRQ